MRIFGISGSLRSGSVNTAILRAMMGMVDGEHSFKTWEGLGTLPHFSTDNDFTASPGPVVAYRALLSAADAIVICTPEYAFGMPGSLKNALDWAVSSGEFDRKPVATISASPLPSGGEKALVWLRQTLTALGALQVEGASISIPAVKGKIGTEGEVTDAETLDTLKKVMDALIAAEVNRVDPEAMG